MNKPRADDRPHVFKERMKRCAMAFCQRRVPLNAPMAYTVEGELYGPWGDAMNIQDACPQCVAYLDKRKRGPREA